MSLTRTFEGYAPPRRYDNLPFTKANIREAALVGGAYTTIERITLSPADPDPVNPLVRSFTTALATIEDGWYIIRWEDASGSTFDSDPIRYQAEMGGELVTVEELTEFVTAAGLSPSEEEIREARDLASARIEDACGVAFSPRETTETVTGTGGTALLSHPKVISVLTVDSEPVNEGPFGPGEIPLETGTHTVTYTHGYEETPLPIKRAVKLLARQHLTEDPSDLDLRATSKSNELATWTLVTPGIRGAKFPIPEVNQIVRDYSWPGGVY